jgi:short-subunit dehydrogenase
MKLKCLITGHTSGIGQYFYNKFIELGFVVDGASRSNGYDLTKNYDDILQKALGYDLVINNAYGQAGYQYKLLSDLNNNVKNIITMGSVAAYFYDIPSKKQGYSVDKNNLMQLNKRLSYNSKSNLLLINVGTTENTSTDPGCTYEDIFNGCLFWLKTPTINQIDFGVKLSQTNIDIIESKFLIKLEDFPNKFF